MAKKKDLQFTVIDNTKLVQEAEEYQIKQALIAIGARVETHAKADYVPVDTGRLKNSITYALAGGTAHKKKYKPNPGKVKGEDRYTKEYSGVVPEDKDGKVRSVYVGTNVEYAEIVENGTAGRSGVHYLRQAVTNHMEEYRALAKLALKGEELPTNT